MKKILLLLSVLILTACGAESEKTIRIASHTEPMTTVIEIATKELENKGYDVELVLVSDNTAANLALNNKEVDANFFQHVPFMNQFNAANKGTLAGVQAIYNAKVGFYSKNYTSLDDLPSNASIAIPNDPVNQARALVILDKQGLIKLNNPGPQSKVSDIKDTPYEIKEVDLLTLSHAYEEVDLVFNYPTYIKAVGLTPKDALLLEDDNTHYYAISLVAREDNIESKKIKDLKEAMTNAEVYEFLTNETNSITLIPSFDKK